MTRKLEFAWLAIRRASVRALPAFVVFSTINYLAAQPKEQGSRRDNRIVAPTNSKLKTVRAVAATTAPRVGVLGYCTVFDGVNLANNLQSVLAADGRFGTVTAVDASTTNPNSAQLLENFDCVIATTDAGCGQEVDPAISNSWSAALTGFAAGNKGLVLTTFGFASAGTIGFGSSIFAPGLSPLLQSDIPENNIGGNIFLTPVLPPACDGILTGVVDAPSISFNNYVTLEATATACLRYLDGETENDGTVAVAINNTGNIFALNAYPYSFDDLQQASVKKLYGNIVAKACAVGGNGGGGGEPVEVTVDVRPNSCPNPFNVKSNGSIPVALIGKLDFNVNTVDPTTIKLNGVSPTSWALADVAGPGTPPAQRVSCTADCVSAPIDGILDLNMEFNTQALAAAIGSVADNDCKTLTLTGKLKAEHGGGDIQGVDLVRIQKPGK